MRWTRSGAVALALCVAACSGKKEAPSGGTVKTGGGATSEPATTAEASPSNSTEIGSFRFGRSLGADGTATREGGPFAQGETLHVSFKLSNAPNGSAVKIFVSALSDKRSVHEEQKNPAGPTGPMSFSLPDTRSWPAGDYRVEIRLIAGTNSKGLGTFDFKITPASSR